MVQKSKYLQYWIFNNWKNGYGHDINSVNPLYLRIDNANGYIEEINEDKYLVFDTYKNTKILKR